MQKKAERPLEDADKFPRESFIEQLSRKFGQDAVALSGPCEGQPLVECVVSQLEKRWNRIKSRFASSGDDKLMKLATSLAESYMERDDSIKCVQDLMTLGYKKEAAVGIASYMKAYALAPANDIEIDNKVDQIAPPEEKFHSEPPAPESPEAPAGDLPPPEGDITSEDPMADKPMDLGDDLDLGSEPGLGGSADIGGEEMVTIQIPKETAKQIADQVNTADTGSTPVGGELGGDVGSDLGAPEGGSGLDAYVEEMPGEGSEVPGAPEGDLGLETKDEVVPGEPAGEPKQLVEGDEAKGIDEASHCAGEPPCPNCPNGSAVVVKEEVVSPDAMVSMPGLDEVAEDAKSEGESFKHEISETPAEEKAEHAEGGEEEEKSEPKPKKKEEKGEGESEEKKESKEAAAKPGLSKKAEDMRRLGPNMSLNNTDQQAGHDSKKLGNAKEKTVEEPKPIADGNFKSEGYAAGGDKVQDGKTMGHEQPFDAKEFDRSSTTGGKSSILGADESYPEGKPQVPAGSAPIGGEQFEGGNLATKGTVIADLNVEITSKGVIVAGNGRKFRATASIQKSMVESIKSGIAGLTWDGDAKKFAQAILAIVKKAEKECCKTDTSKKEAEHFQNDAEKKPEEGGAMTGKGKGTGGAKDEGVTKTDTSKKEANDFQNDADKKPEKDASKAAATKTAKAVEEPKALEDGNVKPEGYTAGDNKFSKETPDFKTISKEEVSKGSKSLMGKDESLPEGKPDVPAGGGKLGNEEFEGGNVSTKGTVIAENNAQNSKASELQEQLNAAKVDKQRLVAAAVYVADLLRNGEITEAEYVKELEKASSMSVPAIQNLIVSTRKARERVAARAATIAASRQAETKVAGMGVPVVQYNDTSVDKVEALKNKFVSAFKLTRDLNALDQMK
jgi:hypothetical protein